MRLGGATLILVSLPQRSSHNAARSPTVTATLCIHPCGSQFQLRVDKFPPLECCYRLLHVDAYLHLYVWVLFKYLHSQVMMWGTEVEVYLLPV